MKQKKYNSLASRHANQGCKFVDYVELAKHQSRLASKDTSKRYLHLVQAAQWQFYAILRYEVAPDDSDYQTKLKLIKDFKDIFGEIVPQRMLSTIDAAASSDHATEQMPITAIIQQRIDKLAQKIPDLFVIQFEGDDCIPGEVHKTLVPNPNFDFTRLQATYENVTDFPSLLSVITKQAKQVIKPGKRQSTKAATSASTSIIVKKTSIVGVTHFPLKAQMCALMSLLTLEKALVHHRAKIPPDRILDQALFWLKQGLSHSRKTVLALLLQFIEEGKLPSKRLQFNVINTRFLLAYYYQQLVNPPQFAKAAEQWRLLMVIPEKTLQYVNHAANSLALRLVAENTVIEIKRRADTYFKYAEAVYAGKSDAILSDHYYLLQSLKLHCAPGIVVVLKKRLDTFIVVEKQASRLLAASKAIGGYSVVEALKDDRYQELRSAVAKIKARNPKIRNPFDESKLLEILIEIKTFRQMYFKELHEIESANKKFMLMEDFVKVKNYKSGLQHAREIIKVEFIQVMPTLASIVRNVLVAKIHRSEASFIAGDGYLIQTDTRNALRSYLPGLMMLVHAYQHRPDTQAAVSLAQYLEANFEHRDFSRQFKFVTSMTKAMLSDAWLYLGLCYLHGIGVAKNVKEAENCFFRLVELGVGKLLYTGVLYGLAKDLRSPQTKLLYLAHEFLMSFFKTNMPEWRSNIRLLDHEALMKWGKLFVKQTVREPDYKKKQYLDLAAECFWWAARKGSINAHEELEEIDTPHAHIYLGLLADTDSKSEKHFKKALTMDLQESGELAMSLVVINDDEAKALGAAKLKRHLSLITLAQVMTPRSRHRLITVVRDRGRSISPVDQDDGMASSTSSRVSLDSGARTATAAPLSLVQGLAKAVIRLKRFLTMLESAKFKKRKSSDRKAGALVVKLRRAS